MKEAEIGRIPLRGDFSAGAFGNCQHLGFTRWICPGKSMQSFSRILGSPLGSFSSQRSREYINRASSVGV
jgi:hypothetical protein